MLLFSLSMMMANNFWLKTLFRYIYAIPENGSWWAFLQNFQWAYELFLWWFNSIHGYYNTSRRQLDKCAGMLSKMPIKFHFGCVLWSSGSDFRIGFCFGFWAKFEEKKLLTHIFRNNWDLSYQTLPFFRVTLVNL